MRIHHVRVGVQVGSEVQRFLMLERHLDRGVGNPVADIPIRHERHAPIEIGEIAFAGRKDWLWLGAEAVVPNHFDGRWASVWVNVGAVRVRAAGFG